MNSPLRPPIAKPFLRDKLIAIGGKLPGYFGPPPKLGFSRELGLLLSHSRLCATFLPKIQPPMSRRAQYYPCNLLFLSQQKPPMTPRLRVPEGMGESRLMESHHACSKNSHTAEPGLKDSVELAGWRR